MSIKFDIKTEKSITYEDFLEFIQTNKLNFSNIENLKSCSIKLKELYNNRNFLSNYIINELKNYNNIQENNKYTAQVIILTSNKDFMIRANIWSPSPNNLSEIKMNAYDIYHDHNFDLLTLGYFGSGYETYLYDYDYNSINGYNKEYVNIRFKEKYQLKEGHILFLEKSRDIHLQCKPRDLSVSINVIPRNMENEKNSQFEFDLSNSSIKRVLNHQTANSLIEICSYFNDDNIFDLVQTISRKSPIPNIRLQSFKALMKMDKSKRKEVLIDIKNDSNKLINSFFLREIEINHDN
ncbi:hypothetical protein QEJ31_08875 [Pigmentibacter sp. JX0631]|uniref:hypothetical protein n=1 Tax=Pigmentibacter sp. JX0631 TaxID=2976982 RepID=UPI0024693C7C|nr:hypothetical protein [Pigmentibacter sp. JX0631]WGL58647.1 hypothetical protein QEJ31_08875 [Pigmentibacter sp. JX0631]